MTNHNQYRYMKDLLLLDACRPTQEEFRVPFKAASPLNLSMWTSLLADHPDPSFTNYILTGIQDGFRLGFDRRHILNSSSGNMPCKVPSIIYDYLQREVLLGRMIKLPPNFFPPGIHISPVGIVPKKNKPGKWRLIMDLSSPDKASINDGISQSLSSLSYVSVDHLSALVLQAGRGAYLTKADIKEAYRMLRVHTQDCHLLGIYWERSIYIDQSLPFGLRSAPKIFTAVADAIQWILFNHGMSNTLHYLDDFILISNDQPSAEAQKQCLVSLWEKLGVPMELSKLEGPSQSLQFLGIEVDTTSLQLRLPEDKLERLKAELLGCIQRDTLFKKELESLVGLLQFATKVVRPGRCFLRRLYSMKDIGSKPNHHVRLNRPAMADIIWWHTFISHWNGISMLWDVGGKEADFTITTDASGSWGCGAYWEKAWFHFQWWDRLRPFGIAIKEMIPIVVAAAIFGRQWAHKIIQFRVDNMAVVEVINATFCKENHLMHLVRLLVFFASYYNFWFFASHIEGHNNTLADALSRNNLHVFFSQAPPSPLTPAVVPEPLLRLIAQNITWTSTAWTRLFTITLHQL